MAEPVDVSFRWDGLAEGPVLVLSHALGTSQAIWDPQVERLADRYRLLRYDHRGHGASPVAPGPYRIEDFGRDLVRLLDRLELERVNFCGLSLGGMVGIWLGANAPDRIDRLILCCTAARMPRPEDYTARAARVRQEGLAPLADQILSRWFSPDFVEEHSDVVSSIRRLLLSTDREGYAASCEALAAMDQRNLLDRITAPTLVVAGALDQATPVAQALEIVGGIKGARLAIVNKAAHLANLEQPDRIAELIRKEAG